MVCTRNCQILSIQLSVNIRTVFPKSDAVATIIFSMQGLGATVQCLLEGGVNKL